MRCLFNIFTSQVLCLTNVRLSKSSTYPLKKPWKNCLTYIPNISASNRRFPLDIPVDTLIDNRFQFFPQVLDLSFPVYVQENNTNILVHLSSLGQQVHKFLDCEFESHKIRRSSLKEVKPLWQNHQQLNKISIICIDKPFNYRKNKKQHVYITTLFLKGPKSWYF